MNNATQRKKQKNRKRIIGLAALLALIVGLLLVYRVLLDGQNTPADTDTADTDIIMLIERDASEITSLAYSRGDTSYSFTRQSTTGTWSYAEEPSFPLNQTPISEMAAAVAAIGVYRDLGEDTGVYGFETPALTVSVTFADGAAHSYTVGALNSATGNRYLKDESTGHVYTAAPALLDYFTYSLEDMLLYDTLPTDIEVDYITAMTLTTGEDVKEITDADGIAALYELFTILAPSEYADWYADAEEKTAFGIGASTLTIDYKRTAAEADESSATSAARVPATYTVQFGDTTEDGKVYYTLGKSDIVYLIYQEQVDSILSYLTYTPAETTEQ